MSFVLSYYLHSGPHVRSCCRRSLLHNSAYLLSKDRYAPRPSTSRNQLTKKGDEPHSGFKREKLPHAGRTLAPERSRRIEPDRRASGNGRPNGRPSANDFRRNAPSGPGKGRPLENYTRPRAAFDRREPPPKRTSGGHSTKPNRPWSGRGGSRSDRTGSSRREDPRTDYHRSQYPPSDRRTTADTGKTWSRDAPRRASFDNTGTQGRDPYRGNHMGSTDRKDFRANDRQPDRRYSEDRHIERTTPYLSSALRLSSSEDTPTTFDDGRQDRELEEGAYDTPEAADEFFHPPEPVTLTSASTPSKGNGKSFLDLDTSQSAFTSPPLLPGFVSALKEMFGPNAEPTPIQSLSIAHCLPSKPIEGAPGWKQFLLASETGSGKSIAYLLPLLQGIKSTELAAESTLLSNAEIKVQSQRLLNPRGLVLAPTHELARQLSTFAKALLHDVKLRVLCASRANEKSITKWKDATSAQMAAQFAENPSGEDDALEVKREFHPVSIVVGTPMKLLEMVRGRGWDRLEDDEAKAKEEDEDELDEEGKPRIKPRRGRDKMVHFGNWRAKPELGLANVEWVVVDEADVLFDPDFQETTRTLLADISAARGHVLPVAASVPVPPTLGQPTSPSTLSSPLSPSTNTTITSSSITPIDYPFNLVLTSATIPKSLNAYLTTHHPSLVRLASPRLHRLPKSLQTEYVGWTGGNKFADVVRRIRRVWAEDAAGGHAKGKDAELSKILVFCNRSAKVDEFAAYLESQGVKSMAMTSRSEQRGRGSNKHLDGFLRQRSRSAVPSSPTPADPKAHPHVLITTSLLSRGLDFSPDIKHVFIVDEPRNTVDFLHRAGRTGRAGEWGKVVIFGKLKGRGSQRTKEVRKRIQGLRAA